MAFLADKLVLFGATGDLSQRMLLPSLCALHADGLVPQDLQIIGTARSEYGDTDFRAFAAKALEQFLPEDRKSAITGFLERLNYQTLDATRAEDFPALAEKVGTPRHGVGCAMLRCDGLTLKRCFNIQICY